MCQELVFNTAEFHNNLEIKSAFEERYLFSKINKGAFLTKRLLSIQRLQCTELLTNRVTSPLWELLDVEMCLKKETVTAVLSMMVILDSNPGQVELRIIFQLLAKQRICILI